MAGVTLTLGVVTGERRGISSFSSPVFWLDYRISYRWHFVQSVSWDVELELKRHLHAHLFFLGVSYTLIYKVRQRHLISQHFRRNCQLKYDLNSSKAESSRKVSNDINQKSHQPITFSRSSHIRMLLPLTTTLQRIFLSLPVISKAFSRAKFIKTSTPITIPSISRPPLSLILSFLATYLLRSGEYPCLGRARFAAPVLPAIYNRLRLQPGQLKSQHLNFPRDRLQFCQSSKYNNLMQKERELFESILCKFIINLPEEEVKDPSRLSYHAQKAFYYYVDEILGEKEMKEREKQRNEFFFKLRQYSSEIIKIDPHQLAAKLQENKPVCGAIVFNRENTKVLVVKVRHKLGFPKGKWNQHETTEACAARQVQEQTGIYIHHRIDPKIRIEFETHGSSSYFFVARGVGQEERTKVDRKQIDGVSWMWIQDVRLNYSRFVQRSKIAWSHYQKEVIKNSETIDQFILEYGKDIREQRTEQQEVFQEEDQMPNPFLSFRFDKKRLRLCLFDGKDS